MHKWSIEAEPGAQPPLDLLPFLRYVPEQWASWKTTVRRLRAVQQDIYVSLVRYCEKRIERGDYSGSALEAILPKLEERGIDKPLLR